MYTLATARMTREGQTCILMHITGVPLFQLATLPTNVIVYTSLLLNDTFECRLYLVLYSEQLSWGSSPVLVLKSRIMLQIQSIGPCKPADLLHLEAPPRLFCSLPADFLFTTVRPHWYF